MFYEKSVLKIFTKFVRKQLYWSLFFSNVIALRLATLLKRDSNTGIFRIILRNFSEHLFYRTPPGDSFCKSTSSITSWFKTDQKRRKKQLETYLRVSSLVVISFCHLHQIYYKHNDFIKSSSGCTSLLSNKLCSNWKYIK